MKENETTSVFGVSNEQITTYIEREKVDYVFKEGLNRNKHIIVYGASKQGKTSLTNQHLNPIDYIKINCSDRTLPIDIYKSLLRQLNIEIVEEREETSSLGGEVKTSILAKLKIPFLGDVESGVEATGKKEKTDSIKFQVIEYNLSLSQDVSELLLKLKFNKRIILENFHYLTEETQKQLAYDLRVYEDYNILFIILGIWREKNRLAQFNGDLLDRVIEIPVEPWEKEDLLKILEAGEPLLNVDFSEIVENMISTCYDSVGVFQELCKEACFAANVQKTGATQVKITIGNLNDAIKKKYQDYSSRHTRCLESFVEQKGNSSEELPLYIPYYFIKVILNSDMDEITEGFRRKDLQDKIKEIHHRSEDVRASDTGYFLKTLVAAQIRKNIMPPIFDFDQSTSRVKIIDSTFYFFLRNCDRQEILEEIPIPVGLSR